LYSHGTFNYFDHPLLDHAMELAARRRLARQAARAAGLLPLAALDRRERRERLRERRRPPVPRDIDHEPERAAVDRHLLRR
jgi:hypothetical protein